MSDNSPTCDRCIWYRSRAVLRYLTVRWNCCKLQGWLEAESRFPVLGFEATDGLSPAKLGV